MRTAIFCVCGLCASALAAPAPRLDGFVNDLFWTENSRTWTLRDASQPDSVARCFLGYDAQYLYFAADVADTNVVGANRTPKSKPWEDDAIRLLLHFGDRNARQWTGETFCYTFSATGGVTWTRGPLPAAADSASVETGWPPQWNSEMNWAVGLKPGTMPNVSGTRDTGYAVEARIPWSELGRRPHFGPGQTIGLCLINICRPELSLPHGKPISSVAAVDRIQPRNPSLWQRVRMDWGGPLPIRGLVEPLPLWLGSTSPEYHAFQAAETDSRGPWWDRSRWTARLERMRSQNMNVLLLRHTNPWTGLLASPEGHTVDTRPAAGRREMIDKTGWLGSEDLARCQDQFRWILDQARQRGIRTWLLFADEPARPAAGQPASMPAEADRLGLSARRLLRKYPQLAGIAVGTGYNSPEILDSVAREMSQLAGGSAPAGDAAAASRPEAAPELLVWTIGIEPPVARRVFDRYPRVRLLHPLQKGLWLKPLADARIQRFSTETEQLKPGPAADPVSNIVIGSLRGPQSYIFWADPQWARTLTLDLRTQGIEGFLLDDGPGEHALAREALFDYAYNAGQRFSSHRWESRLRVYGVGDHAGPLLEAMQHASAIIPESLLLTWEPSEEFMPQFGLLLAEYLELPSYSPDSTAGLALESRAERLGSVGPAWPDPPWGKAVSTVQSEVDRTAPSGSISPLEVAANIDRHVRTCNSLLPGLRHLQPGNPEQARALGSLLDAIELNVALGEHIQNKIRAAIGWAEYKARRGRSVDCTQPLQKSVEAWQKVAELGERLYPASVSYWQSQPVCPPPWSLEYLRSTYTPVTGSWRDQLRRFERELNLIRAATGGNRVGATLPMWDHVNAAPEEKRQIRFVVDFEHPDSRYRLLTCASIIADERRISGKKSLLIDTREMPPGRYEVLVTDVGRMPLVSMLKYQVTLAYRVLEAGSSEAGPPFEIGIRPADRDQPLGDHRTWTAPDGYLDARILQVPPPRQDGNVFYVAVRSPSAVVIDNIQIAQIAE